MSAVLFILIPSLLAGVYYGLIAAPQYSVEVRFAVRAQDGGGASSDLLGMFSGINTPGSTITDSYILMDYLRSRALLEMLRKRLDLEKIFNPPSIDRLAVFSVKDHTIEELVDYWKKMVVIDFDTTSKIIVVEVRTFKAEDSKRVAQEILSLSEELVNQLSERSRQDALRTARQEVERMEIRLRKSLREMRQFRERNQDIDPAQSAAAQIGRLSGIETQRNIERAQLAAQLTFMNNSSPAVMVTRAKIKALEAQADAERSKLGMGQKAQTNPAADVSDAKSKSVIVENYQALVTQLEFAQKAYLTAQAALERARLNAQQQQRYLATFVQPSLPEQAIYPKRVINTLVFALINVCLWTICVLIIYAIRDHAM